MGVDIVCVERSLLLSRMRCVALSQLSTSINEVTDGFAASRSVRTPRPARPDHLHVPLTTEGDPHGGNPGAVRHPRAVLQEVGASFSLQARQCGCSRQC